MPTATSYFVPDKKPSANCKGGSNFAIWVVFVFLLIVNVPIFLCQHLTCDTALYDVQARSVLDGGVLYQDMVEPNLPGVVWIHMFLRTLFGWSTVVLRAFDLAMMASVTLILGKFMRCADEPFWSTRLGFLAVSVFALHFSLLEWCHCQRDGWMLVPCLIATYYRSRRMNSLVPSATDHRRTILRSGVLEGMVWATAFWIKPHIAIPALFVIGSSWFMTGRSSRLVWDGLGVIVGGLVVGAAGSIWLIQSGAWSDFWEMQLNWNPVYVQLGRETRTWSKLRDVWIAFAPWNGFHLAAISSSIFSVRQLRCRNRTNAKSSNLDRVQREQHLLLVALYIGWCVQALTLQFAFMYVFYPTVILAIGLASSLRPTPELRPVVRMCAVCCVMLMISSGSLFSLTRFSNSLACVTDGPTSDVRARIQVEDAPHWQELQPVIEFLRAQHVQDGEVTAYSNHLVQVYGELGIHPSTKFVFLDVLIRLFHDRHSEIQAALETSPQRFVVTSLYDAKLPQADIFGPSDPKTKLPVRFPEQAFNSFPYTQPVVFRSGRYLVHEVTRPLGCVSERDLSSYLVTEPVAATNASIASK